ncbi:MAG: thiamine-phosphate kinase [Terracidiphilus sp.]
MLNFEPKSRNVSAQGKAGPPGGAGRAHGELQILREIRRRAAALRPAALPLGIGDDCALLRPRAGEDLAITTDLSIAGRHFRLEWHSPEAIGHRTLARGLSDLAAMGARPVAAFLSLGLPRELTRAATRRGAEAHRSSWLDRFLDGFLRLAREHRTALAGGDLAQSPVAAADIVLIGAVPRGCALLRSGARPGDAIYVTGSLGGAAAGLARLARLAESKDASGQRGVRVPSKLSAQLAPHLYPQPRLAQGQWLMRRRLATAAIDISDGFSTDLAHICEESDVTAEIGASALPIWPGAKSGASPGAGPETSLDRALNGGEDYELLFTAPPSARLPRTIAGVPVTRVGRILRARKGLARVTLLTARGSQPLAARGWQHFA